VKNLLIFATYNHSSQNKVMDEKFIDFFRGPVSSFFFLLFHHRRFFTLHAFFASIAT